jgi:hypothetical protein
MDFEMETKEESERKKQLLSALRGALGLLRFENKLHVPSTCSYLFYIPLPAEEGEKKGK